VLSTPEETGDTGITLALHKWFINVLLADFHLHPGPRDKKTYQHWISLFMENMMVQAASL